MSREIMTVGVLTGGGDCPGLNAAIRAIVRRGLQSGYYMLGVNNGWKGLVEGAVEPLTDYSVSGILHKGGTILGTSRVNPYKKPETLQMLRENVKKYGLDALVAIGGEDTLSVAHRVCDDGIINTVGVPKTIDNDLSGTDYTFGFDTAVTIATNAIDQLHTTAESHHRIMVVEVMGRHTGWIAVWAGMAGGADYIIIPEKPFDVKEVCGSIRKRHKRGKKFSIIVVAEGATAREKELITQDEKLDEFGHVRLGGIGHFIGELIEKETGIETRVTILGHIQRGGSPTAYDRILATRFGLKAIDLVEEGNFGQMTALQGNDIISIPIKDAVEKPKLVREDLVAAAETFFG